ncbi:response regulator transcription factor [Litchfieldia salsa]|uniref:Two-component system, response regulator YesN n=1 Tax=Litchfieldia salsa TaxID=930152 RepID=A0A1H0PBN7_9BACI|nr:two-component system, response regulator YesN [Litchfieldia salsa]
MSLIDWAGCGFEVIAEAGNGEDALHLINECQPDLVITDIRMPVLDGLKLIQNVTESTTFMSKFIIISGFNDFKYAQQALRFGVRDFILKPIDKDELEETLIKLEAFITQEKKEADIQNQFSINLMLQDLLLDYNTPNLTPQQKKILRIDPRHTFYCYMIMELNGIEKNSKKTEVIKNQIYETIKFVCRTNYRIYLYELREGVFGVIINSNDIVHYQSNLTLFVEKMIEELQRKTKEEITIYIGKEITHIAELKSAFTTANDVMKFKYTQSTSKPIFYRNVENLELKYVELDLNLFNQLMEQLEENNSDGFCSIIDKIFIEFQTRTFAPEAVSTSINRCIHSVIGKIKEFDGDESSLQTLEEIINWKSYNWSTAQLKMKFKHFMIESANLIIKLRKENSKGDIYKIKSYIESNFRENISLKTIANTFFLNPVYMGQLFKKTYGMYFKEYLLNLRLTEAKKLLRQTNKRVYEIAEEVGFGSTDYFVTQFEKHEGTTPTEYRNHILNS